MESAILGGSAEVLKAPARASGPAVRTFVRIAGRWGLSARERYTILGLPRSTYFKIAAKPQSARLSRDTLERISYVLGIYSALQILLPRKEAADAWIRSPNDDPLFKGHAPLEILLGGKVADLFVVRRYLDGERGW
jgi:hypothetical protein